MSWNFPTGDVEVWDINSTLRFIKQSAWVILLQELPADLSSISYVFEDEKTWESISFDAFLAQFPYIQQTNFASLKKENVGENSLFEIYKTYNFLYARFQKAKEKLTKNWFEIQDILEALIKRLTDQVMEAGTGQRKLKNGTVVGLSKYSNTKYEFMKVPYYAFACANVSLDTVKIRNKAGTIYTLRGVDDMMNSTNDEWWLFLPNSMGVSASLIANDNKWNLVFIAQERNNATTLSQNNAKFISSASGAVDFKLFSSWENLDLLHNAVGAEVEEELWINPIRSQLSKETLHARTKWWVESILEGKSEYHRIHALGDILSQEWMQILGRELWLDANLLPAALVMEEKRRNPEFIFLWKAGYSVPDIQKFWQTAESRDESLSIRWITYQEILEELENRKNGWEKKIDDHFFMSYIWFLMKTSQ